MTRWMSAKDAFRHVLEHEIIPEIANKKLKARICRGEIPGKAERLIFRGQTRTDAFIPPNFWTASWTEVDFEKSSAVVTEYSLCGPMNGPWEPICQNKAEGIAFSERHLYACWPPLSGANAEAATARQGRPRKTGMQATDTPLVEEMHGLIKTVRATSPTDAARQVIGRAGERAHGKATYEAKVSRLVRRYRGRHGE